MKKNLSIQPDMLGRMEDLPLDCRNKLLEGVLGNEVNINLEIEVFKGQKWV